MRKFVYFLKSVGLTFLLLQLFYPQMASACSRALWKTDQATVLSRTMDWSGDIKSNIWIYPRDMEQDGLADGNSMKWVSKYGSVVTTAFDAIATDGMNEKGLAAHIFWLVETDFGARNESVPGLSVLMWLQYYLDNFASVDEAIRATQASPFQVESFEIGQSMTVHLILEDAYGDSAILEYVDGKLNIYHDTSYTVATNSPTFDKQLENLKQYKTFGGDKPLPGSTESTHRFVRAAYYASNLPAPTSAYDAIVKILSVSHNVAMPYGASTEDRPEPSETVWHTALDLTHHIYYFLPTATQHLMWVNLDKVNLSSGAPILKLDVVHHPEFVGDVTTKFQSGMMMRNPKTIRLPKQS